MMKTEEDGNYSIVQWEREKGGGARKKEGEWNDEEGEGRWRRMMSGNTGTREKEMQGGGCETTAPEAWSDGGGDDAAACAGENLGWLDMLALMVVFRLSARMHSSALLRRQRDETRRMRTTIPCIWKAGRRRARRQNEMETWCAARQCTPAPASGALEARSWELRNDNGQRPPAPGALQAQGWRSSTRRAKKSHGSSREKAIPGRNGSVSRRETDEGGGSRGCDGDGGRRRTRRHDEKEDGARRTQDHFEPYQHKWLYVWFKYITWLNLFVVVGHRDSAILRGTHGVSNSSCQEKFCASNLCLNFDHQSVVHTRLCFSPGTVHYFNGRDPGQTTFRHFESGEEVIKTDRREWDPDMSSFRHCFADWSREPDSIHVDIGLGNEFCREVQLGIECLSSMRGETPCICILNQSVEGESPCFKMSELRRYGDCGASGPSRSLNARRACWDSGVWLDTSSTADVGANRAVAAAVRCNAYNLGGRRRGHVFPWRRHFSGLHDGVCHGSRLTAVSARPDHFRDLIMRYTKDGRCRYGRCGADEDGEKCGWPSGDADVCRVVYECDAEPAYCDRVQQRMHDMPCYGIEPSGPPATGVPRTRCWEMRNRMENGVRPFATGALVARCCGLTTMGRGMPPRQGGEGNVGYADPVETDRRLRYACVRDGARGAPGAARFGEADNPGPSSGGGASITTANGTGWGTILDWIGSHRGHVICAQEHKVLAEDVEYERRRAVARGWRSLWAPAVPSGTAANQASAGVVVLARSNIGIAEPPGGVIVVLGHVCAAMVEMSGIGWIVIYSVYGHCGDELGARNWEICCAIACHAANHGLQWIAAGDWNFEPQVLRASGWLGVMRADIVAAGVAATTHSGTKQGRHIDYFVASRGVAALGPSITVCADATIRTHDALRMTLPATPRQYVVRRMVSARPFPRELPVGPRRLVPTPTDTVASARAACKEGERGDREAAIILIDDAMSSMISHLESVLTEAYMMDDETAERHIGRAEGVKYAMGPLLGPRTGVHGVAPPTIRRLRRVQDAASALAAAADHTARRLSSAATGMGIGNDNMRMVPTGRIANYQSDPRAVPTWHAAGGILLNFSERGKAAVHAGHHAAAAARGKDDAAEVVCAAYGHELKQIGRWAESCAANAEYYGLHDGVDRAIRDVRTWAGDLAMRAKEAADPCEFIHRSEKAAAVRAWAKEASSAGASAAHRWTKVPDEWRPETVELHAEGASTVTADPGAAVERERVKWASFWSPEGTVNGELQWGCVAGMARPTVEQFRRAARSIPRRTGVGVEGITPADFDALDDEGVEACISILMACEAIGYIPRLIALVIVKMIPKKDGGEEANRIDAVIVPNLGKGTR